ncbi:hypothetical protein N7457_008290 [Penicillium paradoxum]|uniref:uncharacterized protein n=1 Tax=Penicillium paradoxum TaxID=176176 RepID=UPI002548E3F1|nr:uncharacterized protein N7457_008290 [Penicillium paradoxum]KAJ5773394.1 hypothetical protein N7457_008290 [Penicillium paradoxum]
MDFEVSISRPSDRFCAEGGQHPEEMRNLCLEIIHDMAVDADGRENPSTQPDIKGKGRAKEQ